MSSEETHVSYLSVPAHPISPSPVFTPPIRTSSSSMGSEKTIAVDISHHSSSSKDSKPEIKHTEFPQHTVAARLAPVLDAARRTRQKASRKARHAEHSLNLAIGLQIVIGALTAGLSAVTPGRSTQIMNAILGIFATIVSGFLARMRGSGQPELSINTKRDMDKLIRDIEAFIVDWGHKTPRFTVAAETENPASVEDQELAKRIDYFRREYGLLEANAHSKRQPAPPV
ncbi:hypothetical protein SISSUDRAFT_1131318 [Sistotremastrum suecicum HHB10207 ss-3]|uniref:SMODS and SLOG-associating 2TM effector domain-containing protein n=1 Tax=Sistotremastrum suecicum HHB10207 ss-3 TaxID=1314776 RepID=A0A166AB55_9AGAM|nr:hypothetical protein SISSUDRAFT_1131318 [Sistotremastrum suecicum HHB10207 ss-3]